MTEFIGLTPKIYSLKCDYYKFNKAKESKKSILKKRFFTKTMLTLFKFVSK